MYRKQSRWLIIIDGYPQYEDRLPGFKSTLAQLQASVIVICEIDVSDKITEYR
jgi:hypothetical protein